MNVFRGKYNALPGDMDTMTASRFGFSQRGSGVGQGDGNGVIEGCYGDVSDPIGLWEGGGETIFFWIDLTYANGKNINLIDGNFNNNASLTLYQPPSGIPTTALAQYYPQAKIGNGNFVYTYSNNATNYFGISHVYNLSSAGTLVSGANTLSYRLTMSTKR